MKEENNQQLFDIYKLHAELADRVSQRREGANRLFVSILVAVFALIGLLLKLGGADVNENILVSIMSILGIALATAWYLVIRSYRQLNTGKFKALHELEQKLGYPFFQREWELLSKGEDFRQYWRLTVAETLLPIIFVISFLMLFLLNIFRTFPPLQ